MRLGNVLATKFMVLVVAGLASTSQGRDDSLPHSNECAYVADASRAQGRNEATNDPFYQRKTIYVTWIMIWNGSTEKGWWKPDDYNGCKVKVDGTWQSINWNERKHIQAYFDAMLAAGMNVIVADFTNGFRWKWQAQLIQQLCHEHGMKFAIAFNPQGGRAMEAGCKTVWENYAAPELPHAAAYLHQQGKPLVVLYTIRKGYADSTAQDGEYRRKFATVWASGEDSSSDKWGWQVEPAVGPVASANAMFLTGSVKFNSPRTGADQWRRHLSWLDYGFVMAQRNRPQYVIVGSFDDVHERNSWLVADTAQAARGWQMRDVTGTLSTDAWYQRVSDWVLRGKPRTMAGGLIRDGAYRLIGTDGRLASVADNRKVESPVVLLANVGKLDNYLWFYHLGNQKYRIIKLNAGMPLETAGGVVRINWDNDEAAQCWTARNTGGRFAFINNATGEALDTAGDAVVTRKCDARAASQWWTLIEEAVVPR